jgi:hypothetical protein
MQSVPMPAKELRDGLLGAALGRSHEPRLADAAPRCQRVPPPERMAPHNRRRPAIARTGGDRDTDSSGDRCRSVNCIVLETSHEDHTLNYEEIPSRSPSVLPTVEKQDPGRTIASRRLQQSAAKLVQPLAHLFERHEVDAVGSVSLVHSNHPKRELELSRRAPARLHGRIETQAVQDPERVSADVRWSVLADPDEDVKGTSGVAESEPVVEHWNRWSIVAAGAVGPRGRTGELWIRLEMGRPGGKAHRRARRRELKGTSRRPGSRADPRGWA